MKNRDLWLSMANESIAKLQSILNEQLSENYTSLCSVSAKARHKQKVLKETRDGRGILLRGRR